jgi:hypothetical protein
MTWLLSSFFAVSVAFLPFQGYASDNYSEDSDSAEVTHIYGNCDYRVSERYGDGGFFGINDAGYFVFCNPTERDGYMIPFTRGRIGELLDGLDGRSFLSMWTSQFARYLTRGRPPFSVNPLQLESGMSGFDVDEACNALCNFQKKYIALDWKDEVVTTRDPYEIFERVVQCYHEENHLIEDDIDRFQERRYAFTPAAYTIYVIDGDEGCFKFTHGDGAEGIMSWNFIKFPITGTENLRRSRYFYNEPSNIGTIYWGARGAQSLD